MQLPFGVPLVVTNPRAGTGRGGVLERLVTALRAADVTPDVAITTRRGEATSVVREAVLAGRGYIVVVGGDGTVREAVEGLVDADAGTVRGDDPVLAVVGAGSGSDLVRTFGLDRAPEVVARHLVTDDTIGLDVGRVRLQVDGREVVRTFVNVAEVGYGARVVDLANRLPRRIGRARYAAAIVASAPTFRRVPVQVTVDGGTTTEPVCNVLVANGQFFGAGLHVAPRALPTDGLFNVQSWRGSPIDVVRAQPQLRRGTHLARPDVREWRSATVSVTAARHLPVEADGELLGTTPAVFDLLPRRLRFKL